MKEGRFESSSAQKHGHLTLRARLHVADHPPEEPQGIRHQGSVANPRSLPLRRWVVGGWPTGGGGGRTSHCRGARVPRCTGAAATARGRAADAHADARGCAARHGGDGGAGGAELWGGGRRRRPFRLQLFFFRAQHLNLNKHVTSSLSLSLLFCVMATSLLCVSTVALGPCGCGPSSRTLEGVCRPSDETTLCWLIP